MANGGLTGVLGNLGNMAGLGNLGNMGRGLDLKGSLLSSFANMGGLSSIGRAGVYEVVLVVIFEVIACLYIAKQRSL
jgi:hypothetical protein